MWKPVSSVGLLGFMVAGLLAAGCATVAKIPDPKKVVLPQPISEGVYPEPYMSDSSVAPWVERAREAKKKTDALETGNRVANTASNHFLGGFSRAATNLATDVAASEGKKAFIRQTVGAYDTDQYFNTECEHVIFLYGKHSHEQSYTDVLELTFFVLEPIQKKYDECLKQYLKSHPDSAFDK